MRLTMKVRPTMKALLLLAVVLITTGCSSLGGGPISEPVMGVVAFLLAAIDSLLATGALTPEQHAPLVKGVTLIQAAINAAAEQAKAAEAAVKVAEAARWTPTEVIAAGTTLVGLASGATAKVSSILRDRNYTPEELLERRIKRLKTQH